MTDLFNDSPNDSLKNDAENKAGHFANVIGSPQSVVYNEDCMEVMKRFPDKHFDLAIVDPPYGTKQIKNNLHGIIEWNDKIPSNEYFIELQRVSKNRIIWGVNYFNGYIFDVGRIVWDKLLTPIYERTFSHCEIASCSLQKRVTIFKYQWSGNVQNGIMNTKNEGDDSRIHPTQKPIALYEWLLNNYTKAGNKIIDTHLGSGSSRIACEKAGLDFVGCEIDKEYYEAQEERFKNHLKQPRLFNADFL